MARRRSEPSITDEFSNLKLGDARLEQRARILAEALASDPTATLPNVCATPAEIEGMYRFLGNQRVEFDALLEPHRRESWARAEECGRVLAVHDSTVFEVRAATGDEVGYLNTGKPGFFGHVSLLVDPATAAPLGVGAVELWDRSNPPAARGEGKRQKPASRTVKPEAERESQRWDRGVAKIEASAGDVRVVHVMDREGDVYRLLASLDAARQGYVIRHARPRPARSGPSARDSSTTNLMKRAKCVFEREVALSRRVESLAPKAKVAHPARERRIATLRVSARRLLVAAPARHKGTPEIAVNVVRVHEPGARKSDVPVEWLLLTNEPIETAEQIAAVVDAYRARWLIEEFFKAIKSGCAYERRELGTETALHNLLALVMPIAWRILKLRALERYDEATPASEVLTPMQIKLLVHLNPKLPAQPTAAAAIRAIASLGGHMKHNGPPGWLTIYRGFHKLTQMEQGALLYAQMSSEM